MKKKILRVLGILMLVLLGLIIALPFFLEGKIAEIIKNKVNQNINATLDFEEANLSLIKSFPYAYVDLKGISLVNKAPFVGDTLFAAQDIALDLSIKELFKSADDPIGIRKLAVDGAVLHIQVDEAENANYDIALEKETAPSSKEGTSTNFTLDLEEYGITNSEVVYDDFSSGMHLVISEMNHSGTGDLSLENAQLKTRTDALVSFEMDSTAYLNKNKVALDALIGIDLTQNKYTFLENKALVNQLPLVFDGFVQLNEDNQEVDITFKTPSSDFKNFLVVIPEAYSKNIENVETTGNFEVNGQFKGVVDNVHIPKFTIGITSQNASFNYLDLPKAVENVYIDTQIYNRTGIVEDTYVDINRLSFKIDEDQFNLNARIEELLGNTKVDLHADGVINLANISQAYPLPADYNLTGIVHADVTTAFDMASVENHRYENTKTSGTARLTGFHYNSEELKNPIAISDASVSFTPDTVSLNAFEGKTGQTDFKANGTIDNLLGYLFNKENIEGNFSLQSNTFAVNDFMTEETSSDGEGGTTPEVSERVQIPSFLDCTIDASAQNVLYDDLALKNMSGRLRIKDETAYLEDVTSSIFDGKVKLNGSVSTKPETPTFDMAMGLDAIKISESFQLLDMFKALAPVANALEGRLSTDIKLSGNLKEDMTPNLATLSGDLLAQLLSAKVDTKNAPLLTALDGQFAFLDLKRLNLNDLKTALSFSDGKVSVKPFAITYQDIVVNVSGGHTFDRQLAYTASLDIPAKYMGDEVNTLIAKINDDSLKDLTIPVTATIGGNYTSPKVTTDLTSGVKNLTAELVEIQKQKLLNQGKDKAKDFIGGLLKEDKTDSAETQGSGVTDALGGLLGGKKDAEQMDTTTAKKDEVKEAAISIIGGLLKKKKDTTQ